MVPVSWSPETPCSSAMVHQQQQRGGGVDRHRRGDLAERDPVEEHAHVVDRVDRDADLADLAVGDGRVGVVAHLGGQVEGDGESAGAVRDELLVALVGLLGGAEAGVLAHRPGPPGVHGGVDAAGVEEVPRLPELGRGVEARERVRAVHRLERESGLGGPRLAFLLVSRAHGRRLRRVHARPHREMSNVHRPPPRWTHARRHRHGVLPAAGQRGHQHRPARRRPADPDRSRAARGRPGPGPLRLPRRARGAGAVHGPARLQELLARPARPRGRAGARRVPPRRRPPRLPDPARRGRPARRAGSTCPRSRSTRPTSPGSPASTACTPRPPSPAGSAGSTAAPPGPSPRHGPPGPSSRRWACTTCTSGGAASPSTCSAPTAGSPSCTAGRRPGRTRSWSGTSAGSPPSRCSG